MQVATYKGRVVAIKTVSTRHVDITRSLKKELKRVRFVQCYSYVGVPKVAGYVVKEAAVYVT